MDTIWWVLLGIIIAPIAWFLLQFFVGAVTPREVSGGLLLRKELKRYGINPNLLGDELLSELTSSAIEMARLFKEIRREGETEAIYKNVQLTATAVASYLRGEKPLLDNDPTFQALLRRGLIRESSSSKIPPSSTL